MHKELKKIISDTLVISGHGPNDTDNFTTIDKMYLLSTKEIWGSGIALEYDTTVETRQLDYYKNLGVSSNNYNESKKYNLSGSLSTWWLRSADCVYNNFFYIVYSSGDWSYSIANSNDGVSPAFRIG